MWPEKWSDLKKSNVRTCPVKFDVQRYLICFNRILFRKVVHGRTDRHTNLILLIYYKTRADARRGEWLQGGWIRADARLRADARGPG